MSGANLLLSVDGGLRSGKKAAAGFALHSYTRGHCKAFERRMLLRRGIVLDAVESAFMAEALALEAALDVLLELLGPRFAKQPARDREQPPLRS